MLYSLRDMLNALLLNSGCDLACLSHYILAIQVLTVGHCKHCSSLRFHLTDTTIRTFLETQAVKHVIMMTWQTIKL